MAAPYNVFVGQTDDDSNFADVILVSDDVEIKESNNVGQVSKGFFSRGAKVSPKL